MYDSMKKAFDASTTKIAPLKSTTSDIIKDWGKEMERWEEHCQELYSRENTVTDSAVKSTCTLLILEELYIPPSVEELSKAIDSLDCGKAPGKDGILPEVIKAGKQTALLQHLHELLLQCWEEGTVPQDMLMPTSSPYRRIKVTTVTAAITVESPSSALLGRPSPTWYWTGCRCLLSMFTKKCSVDSGLQDQQLTWSSHYISSKRSAASRGDCCTSGLLTWPRLLTWSAEKASLLYC